MSARRAGDQAAWEELFYTCYPKVVRVVRRKLNAPMRSLYDSTDFASDVWGSLVAKSDRFDFPNVAALMAFLTKAAEQKVIDEYRRGHTLLVRYAERSSAKCQALAEAFAQFFHAPVDIQVYWTPDQQQAVRVALTHGVATRRRRFMPWTNRRPVPETNTHSGRDIVIESKQSVDSRETPDP